MQRQLNFLSEENEGSLGGAHRSLGVHSGSNRFRQFLGFAGPGYMVSVGYMDPGNWATDLAAGSHYGYALVWVILLSNFIAMFLQTLCARLGIVTGQDLAQSCRGIYKRPVTFVLWLFCELAIIACDLAEVIGSAVALSLLFHIPLLWGVMITGLDVFLLLGAAHFGFRKLEAIIVTLVFTIAACFALQVFFARPDWLAVAHGAVVPTLPDHQALALAVGIL